MSIMLKGKSLGYRAVLAIARRWGVSGHTAALRRLLWDTAPAGSLLLSSGGTETFVVASGDRYIGRTAYLEGKPFDFDKVGLVFGLLGSKKPRLLIDIGANIGTICIPAVKRGLVERAVAIEPEGRNFSLLMANVALNGVAGRIEMYNIALGARDGETLTFDLSEDNFGDHRVHVDSDVNQFDEGGRRSVAVPSQTFDTALAHVDLDSALIWMDTQGFEGFVLAGASKALRRGPPLVIEFWPYAMRRAGSFDCLKEALFSSAYRTCVDLSDGAQRPLSAAVLNERFNALSGNREWVTDLLIR